MSDDFVEFKVVILKLNNDYVKGSTRLQPVSLIGLVPLSLRVRKDKMNSTST